MQRLCLLQPPRQAVDVSELEAFKKGRVRRRCYSHSVGLFFLNNFETVNAMQHATCTKGPYSNVNRKLDAHSGFLTSFPSERPDATAKTRPSDLIRRVHGPRNSSKT